MSSIGDVLRLPSSPNSCTSGYREERGEGGREGPVVPRGVALSHMTHQLLQKRFKVVGIISLELLPYLTVELSD